MNEGLIMGKGIGRGGKKMTNTGKEKREGKKQVEREVGWMKRNK